MLNLFECYWNPIWILLKEATNTVDYRHIPTWHCLKENRHLNKSTYETSRCLASLCANCTHPANSGLQQTKCTAVGNFRHCQPQMQNSVHDAFDVKIWRVQICHRLNSEPMECAWYAWLHDIVGKTTSTSAESARRTTQRNNPKKG